MQPFVVNRVTKTIVGGHQRFSVIDARRKRDGLKRSEVKVAVMWVDADEAQTKALNLALNKIQGEWDYDKLTELMADLSLADDAGHETGFTVDEIQEMLDIKMPEPDLALGPLDANINPDSTGLQSLSAGERVISFKMPEADVKEIENTLVRFGSSTHTDRPATLLRVVRYAVAQRETSPQGLTTPSASPEGPSVD